MPLIKKAYQQMYPEKEFSYESKVRYSSKFNSYNANIKLRHNKLQVNLSRKWKNIDDDIKIGLIQELLNKLFKTRVKTNNIDMYNIFIKKIALYTPKTKTEPVLEDSFNRVNEKYFCGMVEKPNLVLCNSKNRLGSYDFGSDTISISRVLPNKQEYLDYVMYHEMLHKKLKFEHNSRRITHHTRGFKEKEKEFENSEKIEKELSRYVRRCQIENKKFINKPSFLHGIKNFIERGF